MSETPDVILLRSADDPDPYVSAFAEVNLRATCEPVLSFAFPNREALRERLEEGGRYAGLIATSPRVGEALDRVLSDRPDLVQVWRERPVYAVGPKTAGRLRTLGLSPRGADAGDAEALAERIVDDAPRNPLLFLCGNRRRDTLPDRLERTGVPFDELIVYETHVRDCLDLPSVAPYEGWLVFFSPSGLEAIRQADSVKSEHLHDSRIAAIGPTTGGALEEAGFTVEAVASEPSPEGLVEAIIAAQVQN